MIEPQTRLSYLGRISKFVLDEKGIAAVWVHKKKGITSVTEFDELYVQLFDDLAFGEFENELPGLPKIDLASRNKIVDFLNALRYVDNEIEANSQLREPAKLLSSEPWKKFKVTCEKVLEIPAVQEALRSNNPPEHL
jgi:hypothetical protein